MQATHPIPTTTPTRTRRSRRPGPAERAAREAAHQSWLDQLAIEREEEARLARHFSRLDPDLASALMASSLIGHCDL